MTQLANVHLPEGPDNSPLALIRLALEKQIPPDQMTALYNLAERHREEIARKAFARDFNLAQQKMVAVVADQRNTHTQSMYAKLEAVQRMAKPIWTDHGFAISFSEGDILTTGLRTVLLTCRHADGHVDVAKGHYPIDGTGAKGGSVMNPLQGTVSSNSYAHRDMLRQYWSIPIGGADDDGNSAFQGISDGQAEDLNNLLEAYRKRVATEAAWEKWRVQYWKWLKCTSMNDLKEGDFLKAKAYIEELLKEPKK